MEPGGHELQDLRTESERAAAHGEHVRMSASEGSRPQVGMPSDVVDAELNRRVVRKLDFILLPFLALLFLFNSLDKSNIGNAETAGFTKDAGLSESDLNTAVIVFFTFFVALQPVGAALGRRYGMSVYVPTCMSLWGVCTALHIWVKAKWQLIVLRMVIGTLESGFYPVTVSYLSLYYTKFEFARRLAVFYGQSALAGAFGGVLSYFVFSWFPSQEPSLETELDWKSWQVLFMVEGCITVVIALTGFFWLPHSAGSAWFLTPNEREWAEERIRRDAAAMMGKSFRNMSTVDDHEQAEEDGIHGEEAAGLLSRSRSGLHARNPRNVSEITDERGLSTQDVLSAFLDWKVWYLLACNIIASIPVTTFSVFLPLVLQPLIESWTSRNDTIDPDNPKARPALTNLLAAPPFLLGAAVLFLFTSYSDRHRTRLYPILVGIGILLVGLTLTTLLPQSWAIPRYLALCVLLSGSFVSSPLQVVWLSNNIPQTGKRSVVLGINGWGNFAGVFSAWLFQPKFAPTYHVPFFITFALVGIAWVAYWLFRMWVLKENDRRDREGIRPNASQRRISPLKSILTLLGFHGARKRVDELRDKEIADEEAIDFRYAL